MRGCSGVAAGLLIVGLLVGCVTEGAPRNTVSAAATPAAAQIAVRPAPTDKPATQPPAARTALPEPRLSSEELDPRRLLRMRDGQLSNILGRPGFVRRDATARVWQYRTPACVLDLFLYDEAAGYRVVYYEFRPTNGDAVSVPDCFENLLLRGAATASS
jgi:hypothetical protein